MPRRPRIDLPGIAQHVVQRGNDRQPCFFDGIDYVRYLQDLREIVRREQCAVHAYVLMTNHVHLLMTPSASGQIGRVMQALGRRYVRYINEHYRRTGTLWEGRYKSCPVADDRYLLQCQRYIELNPLRARMVADPADYRWSSHRHNAIGEPDPLIHPHPAWRALGSDLDSRRQAWRALVMETIAPAETEAIRLHLQRQHLYAPDRFRRAIEAQLGRATGPAKLGRPRKRVSPINP
ncbi:transposase [Lysobacter maris]|uniref:Transposase n=1 Tax=Marilutibacter maris TaxID=1605891 RepID=A0A508B5S8_9GAMM|nr:transposase [Lysobacter maris]KAB8193914.1 transposase [Lysobacter maris]